MLIPDEEDPPAQLWNELDAYHHDWEPIADVAPWLAAGQRREARARAYQRALVARALAEARRASGDAADPLLPPQPPRRLEGYCPRCNTLAGAAAWGAFDRAEPLACATCGTPLHAPILVARRAAAPTG